MWPRQRATVATRLIYRAIGARRCGDLRDWSLNGFRRDPTPIAPTIYRGVLTPIAAFELREPDWSSRRTERMC